MGESICPDCGAKDKDVKTHYAWVDFPPLKGSDDFKTVVNMWIIRCELCGTVIQAGSQG